MQNQAHRHWTYGKFSKLTPFLSGLDMLINYGPAVNQSALMANGYCFGGTMVLELARTGAQLLGVSSFHGELHNLTAMSGDNITCAVQVVGG